LKIACKMQISNCSIAMANGVRVPTLVGPFRSADENPTKVGALTLSIARRFAIFILQFAICNSEIVSVPQTVATGSAPCQYRER